MDEKIERCSYCDTPTGNAGVYDGSLYLKNGIGPLCECCYDKSDEGKIGMLADALSTANARILELERERDEAREQVNDWGRSMVPFAVDYNVPLYVDKPGYFADRLMAALKARATKAELDLDLVRNNQTPRNPGP